MLCSRVPAKQLRYQVCHPVVSGAVPSEGLSCLPEQALLITLNYIFFSYILLFARLASTDWLRATTIGMETISAAKQASDNTGGAFFVSLLLTEDASGSALSFQPEVYDLPWGPSLSA